MSEIYEPPQEAHTTNPQEQPEDNFAQELEWQAEEAARRAQNLINAPVAPQVESTDTKSGWSTRAKITTGIVLGATLGTGVTLFTADHILPGKEVASASTTVQQGEGIERSIDRDIDRIESQNVDPADATERQDVISLAVDIHADQNGIVQPGENVTVIAVKSPIFGDVTYEAVPNDSQESK